MFEAYGIPFASRSVIDARTEATAAQRMIRDASCVFLMGGHPGLQRALLRALRLDEELRRASAAILGVSAGSINMARRSLDTKESPIPYDGLGLANITVKPHFSPEDKHVLAELLRISATLPICATEDESAIFVADDDVSFTGSVHWVSEGRIEPLSLEKLNAAYRG